MEKEGKDVNDGDAVSDDKKVGRSWGDRNDNDFVTYTNIYKHLPSSGFLNNDENMC